MKINWLNLFILYHTMIKNQKYNKIESLKSNIELNLILLEFLYETPIDDEEYDKLVNIQEEKVKVLLRKYNDLITDK